MARYTLLSAFRDILTLLEKHPWTRVAPLLVAGWALVVPVEWAVRAVSPTTETRAVVAESGIDTNWRGRHVDYDSLSVAVTADGRALDLVTMGAGNSIAKFGAGTPVIVTQSAADGRILQVTGPLTTVDANISQLMMVLLCVVTVGGALLLGLRAKPRNWIVAVLSMALGALLLFAVFPRKYDLGPYQGVVPNAMGGYAEPPTAASETPSTEPVDTIVPLGTPAQTTNTTVTVAGPPERGLPAGADPEVGRGFATLRVPLLAEPGPRSGLYGHATDSLPNMHLIGEGIGRTIELSLGPACGGSPEGFPGDFQAPRRGFACFVVPDGFDPRYLVYFNDSVAVDLRTAG